jgi:hypothetical protein
MVSTRSDLPITLFIQSYISKYAQDILIASKATGVPATAIAMAIANEMRLSVYGEGDSPTLSNWVQDRKVSTYSSAYLRAAYNTERTLIDNDVPPRDPYIKAHKLISTVRKLRDGSMK